jgi:hypothetical protein
MGFRDSQVMFDNFRVFHAHLDYFNDLYVFTHQ